MHQFPKNFYFGAATSAHQVEGGNTNDWTEWEARTAKLKVKSSKLKVWPDFILKNYPNPLQNENYISGRACDHYHRFREDFDLAKEIGLNAYRFSIEWSRIEPEEGKFDESEIAHYREVIAALRERGIEPFVTLWHWTMPQWFSGRGGWESPDATFLFSRFAKRMAQEFKGQVRLWIVLNEPGLWSADAYLLGVKPPTKRNLFKLIRVYFALIRTHKAAYRALKEIDENFQVGIAESMEWHHISLLRPILHYLRNYFFIARIKNYLDFIGVNYFKAVGPDFHKPRRSDMVWEIYPRGLYFLLKQTHRAFQKPIYVTENGVADARDELRGKFISDHLRAVSDAIAKGVDIRGYFYWSLLDNFEWNSGFWPRFGLIEMDYKTMNRKMRPSAFIYKDKEIIQRRSTQ